MLKPSRQAVLLGGTVAIGATTLMSEPSDKSRPRDPYFVRIQSTLLEAGIATPTLVIDRARLNANVDTLVSHLPSGMGYRIVAKSLPSLALIDHIRRRTQTNRLMTFNLPMLLELSRAMPDANQLLGKPLPVQASKTYFETLAPEFTDAQSQVH